MKQNIAEKARALVEDKVKEAGFTLWDVRYEKEAGDWTLVFELDRGENMSMSDCEEANSIIEPIIDEADPIADPYVLEVSSAGLTRVLRTEYHYAKAIENGWDTEFRFFKAENGAKELKGVVTSQTESTVTVNGNEISKKNIAKATAILG